MTKLLWISYCAPYKQVAHAGGKNHYYWLKKVEEDSSFEIRLITCCKYDEYDKIKKMDYQFDYYCCVSGNSYWENLWQRMQSIVLAPYSLHKFAGCVAMYKVLYVKRLIRRMKNEGYKPDTILLQWTQMGLLYDWIKKIYPMAKLVIMEEDISFQRTGREVDTSTGVSKIIKKYVHKIMYKQELKMCSVAERIIVNNRKDINILKNNGIDIGKIVLAIPYYDNLSDVRPNRKSMNILFYGAMNRQENINAVTWFAENVMPKLRQQADFKFVILGGNPTEEVKRLKNEYIEITGFVEDIKTYFSDALCLVVPLFGGAGIKIKVLEGLSSSIPVLTNEIGIEGITASDGIEYCRCDSVNAYVSSILDLYKNPERAQKIGENGRAMVLEKYNAESSVGEFRNILKR